MFRIVVTFNGAISHLQMQIKGIKMREEEERERESKRVLKGKNLLTIRFEEKI